MKREAGNCCILVIRFFSAETLALMPERKRYACIICPSDSRLTAIA